SSSSSSSSSSFLSPSFPSSSSIITGENPTDENPQTGVGYVYYVFVLGIASIFYIAWYTKNIKLNN
ncbi:MAG: hypothetical protein IJO57_00915, partial [Bacilli bacterium]|nr:hypothetical protein [Bacilli bacterium]